MPEHGFRWGVYERGVHGFRVLPYRGTKRLVAVATTVQLAFQFAKRMNAAANAVGPREREERGGR